MSARYYAKQKQREAERRLAKANSLSRVLALFDHAFEAGKKFPKITLVNAKNGSVVVLSRTGKRARCGEGCINITDDRRYPDNTFYGRILRSGQFEAGRHESAERVRDFVKIFNDDPVSFAKAQGDLTSNCCFCGLTLTNQDSIARGYGPICAEKHGLPKGGEKLDRTYEPESAAERDLRELNEALEGAICKGCGYAYECHCDAEADSDESLGLRRAASGGYSG